MKNELKLFWYKYILRKDIFIGIDISEYQDYNAECVMYKKSNGEYKLLYINLYK